MPRQKLTDAAVKGLRPPPKPQQIEYFDTLFPALAVRVSYSGAKTFVLHKRILHGKLKRLTLGRYPALTLAAARQKARDWGDDVQRGLNPISESVKREAAAVTNTFAATVDRFLESQGNRLRSRTLTEYRRFFKGADMVDWENRQIETITRADVSAVLDKIDARGHRSASNHAFSYLRIFFNWCVDRDLIGRAPTERMKARHLAPSRDRVLSADELTLILAALDSDSVLRVLHGLDDPPGLSETMRDFTWLLLLTGQRRAEVAGMAWDEIRDFDGSDARWEIPAARTKNRRDHIVPLPPAAVAVLKRRREGKGKAVMAFGKTGETSLSGFSRAKRTLDARVAALCTAQDRSPLPHWTWHDLRRTMVTMMNEKLGIAPHIVEAVVNHISGAAKAGVAGVYNRALYLRERREALEAWAGYVERLGSGRFR